MTPSTSLPSGRRADYRAVIVIAALAFGLRIAVLFALDAQVIPDDWDFGYESGRIAASLAEDDGFSSPFRRPTGPTAWLAPIYPAILSFVFSLFGVYSTASAVAILLFNSLVSALTCIAVYALAEHVFDRMTGVLSAVALALYPPSIWHSVNTIWDTSLLGLLAVLLLLLIYRGGSSAGLVWGAGFGLATGFAALVSPVLLVVLPLAWTWVWLHHKGSPARRLGVVAMTFIVAALTVAPWMARNQARLGRPYLRSNLGLELELGNSDLAWEHHQTGDLRAPWLRGHPSVVSKELDRFIAVGETAYVEQARAEALAFIRTNPGKFLRLSSHRIYVFWLSDLGTRNEWAGNLDLSISLTWMRVACHLVPLPFLLIGVLAAVRKHHDVLPIMGFFLLFPLVYYITHVSERYRFPVEPLIVVLSSYGLLRLTDWFHSRRTVPNSTA